MITSLKATKRDRFSAVGAAFFGSLFLILRSKRLAFAQIIRTKARKF